VGGELSVDRVLKETLHVERTNFSTNVGRPAPVPWSLVDVVEPSCAADIARMVECADSYVSR